MLLLSRFSHVWFFVTLWTGTFQAPLSMGLSRQEYWCGLPCPPPGDLPDPEIEPASPALQADSLPMSHHGNPFLVHRWPQFCCGITWRREEGALWNIHKAQISFMTVLPSWPNHLPKDPLQIPSHCELFQYMNWDYSIYSRIIQRNLNVIVILYQLSLKKKK